MGEQHLGAWERLKFGFKERKRGIMHTNTHTHSKDRCTNKDIFMHPSTHRHMHAYTNTHTHTGGPLCLPELPSVEPAVQVGLNEK